MKDIAEMAGVSIATVSRAINEPEKLKPETHEKIQALFDETGFVANAVARGLVVSSMRTIGVLTTDIRSIYFSHVTYTVERMFSQMGYNVLLCNTGSQLEDKRRSLRLMLEKQIDGLILVGSVFKETTDNRHIIEAGRRIPVVMINACLEGEPIASVLCDDAGGIRSAVDHLVCLGHKSIGFFKDVDSFSSREKLSGFQTGMICHGLNTDEIVGVACSIEGGRDGLRRIMNEGKKVTALIAGEDSVAIGIIQALVSMGLRVPEDMSVIGYNNTILAEASTPPLTSVNNKAEMMAKTAVEKLWRILQDNESPSKTLITPELVVRESTGQLKVAGVI